MRLLQDLACWLFFTLAIAVVLPLALLIVLVFDEDDFSQGV